MAEDATEVAPDGSIVRPLSRTDRGSMARFSFAAGAISQAVRHRKVEELWYVLAGEAEIWREAAGPKGEVSPLIPGSSLVIPPGCAFQVRVSATEPLEVVAVTMPPWPGDEEAERVAGIWDPASASD